MISNKLLGGYIGLILADALSAPHASQSGINVPLTQYTGKIIYSKGEISSLGTLVHTALQNIVVDQNISVDHWITEYLKWGQTSKPCPIDIFQGISTLNGYKKRFTKILGESSSQGNISLLRGYALIYLQWLTPDIYKLALEDTQISHSNAVNYDCTMVYLICANYLLQGMSPKDILPLLIAYPQTDEVKLAIQQVINNQRIIQGNDKNWVVHSLYLALYILYTSTSASISQNISTIIHDPCTACICGSLLGLYYGYDSLLSMDRDNIQIVGGQAQVQYMFAHIQNFIQQKIQ